MNLYFYVDIDVGDDERIQIPSPPRFNLNNSRYSTPNAGHQFVLSGYSQREPGFTSDYNRENTSMFSNRAMARNDRPLQEFPQNGEALNTSNIQPSSLRQQSSSSARSFNNGSTMRNPPTLPQLSERVPNNESVM